MASDSCLGSGMRPRWDEMSSLNRECALLSRNVLVLPPSSGGSTVSWCAAFSSNGMADIEYFKRVMVDREIYKVPAGGLVALRRIWSAQLSTEARALLPISDWTLRLVTSVRRSCAMSLRTFCPAAFPSSSSIRRYVWRRHRQSQD